MEIVRRHLEKEYEAQAIILAGSRSCGDYKEDSDWDLYVLTEKEIEFHPKLEGYQLDIYCLNPNENYSFDKFGWNYFTNYIPIFSIVKYTWNTFKIGQKNAIDIMFLSLYYY